jgi:hypothetical protein
MIQPVERSSIGPTGWATIANGPRERVNINSRGCLELIRASTRTNDRMTGPYDGWCTCRPTSHGSAGTVSDPIVDIEALAGAWRWRVLIGGQLVRVVRYDDAGRDATFDFDLASPDYSAPTQARLEVERKERC